MSEPETPDETRVTLQAAVEHDSAQPLAITIRNYFSSHLLWMAVHGTEQAGAIEAAHTGRPRFDLVHRAHVLSAIVGSVAFLEATVNELFQDAEDKHGVSDDGYLAPLEERTIDAIAAAWRGTDELRGVTVLGRWDLLLICAGKRPLDRGAAPYQDAQYVVRLRNAVAHARSEDVDFGSTHATETRIKGKFADNRLMATSANPWWPDHCLGHGCAEWATRSVVALADRVTGDLGIRPNYSRHRRAAWL